VTRTGSVFTTAQQYLCGLFQTDKKNMERMEEKVPDSDEQVLQQFLTNSPWSHRDVMNQVALDTDMTFGDDPDSCLIIDESGIPKKGDNSAGVARQWCGQLGKIENCQVGVYGALTCGKYTTLIDARLFLPEIWTSDVARCNAAGIPAEEIIPRSKCDLALEIVANARSNGTGYKWVGVDGGYGKEPAFLRSLADGGDIFVADVHKDQRIYLEDPKPVVPKSKSKKGRKASRLVAQSEAHRVDQWTKSQPDEAWSSIAIREGTRGKVLVELLHKRVWLWDGKEETPRCWHLIVRREPDARDEIKYSLSNAEESETLERLAFMQGQRYWVERALQDAKSEVGLGEYQARKWNSWHHHMALVMMTLLFMLKARISNTDKLPLLSCRDVKIMLAHFLPDRAVTLKEVVRQMETRHKKRQASIDSASRKQERSISSRGT